MSSPSSKYLKVYYPEKGKNQWVMIQAGAGAGKTTELVSRVLSFGIEFRKKQGRWPKLVVTTFTVKATEELKERITKAVLKAVDNEPLPYAEELMDWIRGHSIFITTIHGLVLKYLREQGEAIRLFTDFKVTDKPDRNFYDFLKRLYFHQPLLAQDIDDWLVENRFQDFSNLVYNLLLQKLSYPDLKPINVKNEMQIWHSLRQKALANAQRLVETISKKDLSTDKRRKGYEHIAKFASGIVVDTQSAFNFYQNSQVDLSRLSYPSDTEGLVKNWKLQLEDLCDARFSSEYLVEVETKNKKMEQLLSTLERYWLEAKSKEQALGISEIEPFGLYLARTYPHSAQSFSKSWDYWFIDEFQDTAPEQNQLLSVLMGDRYGFYVGDPQQSIYLFRGSRPYVFENQWEKVKSFDGDQIFLRDNYRSSPKVLTFINQVMQAKPQSFSSMVPKSEEVSKSEVSFFKFELEADEKLDTRLGAGVAQCVFDLVQQGVALGEIVVLGRKRKDLNWIAESLKSQGISYQLHLGGAYFNRREILDALSLLRFLISPEDNTNLLQLMRSPFSNLTDEQLFQVCKNSSSRNIWSEIKELFSESPTVQKLAQALNLIKELGIYYTWRHLLVDLGFFKVAYAIDPSGQKEANLWKLIHLAYEAQGELDFSWHQFYWSCMDQVQMESSETDAVSDLASDRVQLMTIHASKGLEFECVILPQFEARDGNSGRGKKFYCYQDSKCFTLPVEVYSPIDEELKPRLPYSAEQSQSQIKDWENEEKDRLLYVGLTRAKSQLIIPWFVKTNTKAEKIPFWINAMRAVMEPQAHKISINDNTQMSQRRQGLEGPTHPPAPLAFEGILNSRALAVTLSHDQKSIGWQRMQKRIEGTRWHHKLESLKSQATKSVLPPDLTWISKELPEFLTILKHSQAEWGFRFSDEGQMIEGRIDLWSKLPDGRAFIFDYKTGESLDLAKAWDQLTIYKKALVRMGMVEDEKTQLGIIAIRDEKVFLK